LGKRIGTGHLIAGAIILVIGFTMAHAKLSRVTQSAPLSAPPHLPGEARLRGLPASPMTLVPILTLRF
jgi:hypothetical protein